MTVLVAPDKFKGSLTAAQVASALAGGLRAAGLAAREFPVADGGEGTVAAAVAAGFRRVPVRVSGPTGRRITAFFALRGDVAVVELAEASGLHRLPGGRPAPVTASSHGTGELIAAARAAGARRIVLGAGGSACTDGGAGMLMALGARVLDSAGATVGPGGLTSVSTVDLSGLPALELELACDVDNPLLGPFGAAAVYGPQKGASPEDIRVLEAGLRRWASFFDPGHAATAGAGAAGGVGFAAVAALGARVRPGIELLLDLLGFTDAARTSRLILTGEGSLDPQSLHGKAPIGVLRAATALGRPTVAVAGRCLLTAPEWRAAGFSAVHALADLEPDPERCMADARTLLHRTGERIARDHTTIEQRQSV
ncbi:MAG TPA: glycerate kinase [Amycolatopsis sp.]|nr:glycerate kinase [Amycolatopsis sp.]